MTHTIAALERVNLQLPELLSGKFVGNLARRVRWRWRKRVLSPVLMVHLLILQILHRLIFTAEDAGRHRLVGGPWRIGPSPGDCRVA